MTPLPLGVHAGDADLHLGAGDAEAFAEYRARADSWPSRVRSRMYIVPWRGPVPGAGLRRGVADRAGELDPDELIYLINRYSDPASGQFLSVDPDVAQTQQSYAYVVGDPVNDTDPTGGCTPAPDLPCPTGSPVAAESPSGAGGDEGSSTEDQIERLGKYLEEGIWKYWSVVNADHFAAVMASVNNIVEQLVGFGYSVGEIKKGMVLERAIEEGSKKKNGNIGFADITFEDRHGFINVWEVKASSYGAAQAKAEAEYYAEKIGSNAGLGFPLVGIAEFP